MRYLKKEVIEELEQDRAQINQGDRPQEKGPSTDELKLVSELLFKMQESQKAMNEEH